MTSLPSLCRMLTFNLYRTFEALESLSTGSCHSTNTWTILADRAITTSAHCGISGSRCLMKLPRLSLAVWLVTALTTAILSGMSKSNFTKLQRVQKTLARVVLRRRKFEHIKPALKELHWLPVQYCVTFKTAALVHSMKNTGQPAYLRQLLQDYEPVRSLRSSTKNLICKLLLELYWHLVVSDIQPFMYGILYLIIFMKPKLVTF